MLHKLLEYTILSALVLMGTRVMAQMPDCSKYYKHVGSSIITVDPLTNTHTTNTISTPNNSNGLAINNNLNAAAPSPTFYTCVGSTYYYYNGSTWVNTGHSTGSSAAVNPGGAGPYIYNLDGLNSRLYRYNGTGNSTLFLNLGSYGGPYDVIGDSEGNVYIFFNSGTNRRLAVYNPAGQNICNYTFVNLPAADYGGGYAIVDNKIFVNAGANYYSGTISGTTITFSPIVNTGGGTVGDYANCPFPPLNVTLTPSATNIDMCSLQTLTITGTTSVTNPQWNWTGPGIVSGNGTSTITINQPGTYTAVVSSSGGACTGTATSSVTITASGATPPVIVQPSAICINATPIQLNVNSTTGTWSSNCGACLSATGMFNPSVAGIGSHQVTYTTTGSCSGTDTKTIVVNALPIINAGTNLTACPGAPVTLTASGGTSYIWSSGGTTASTSVTPTAQTNYIVTGTDVNGCVNTDTIMVSLHTVQPPVISGNASYCAGFSAGLTASQGYTAYTWSTGATTNPTTATVANNPVTVTATDANGCRSTSIPYNTTELTAITYNNTISICQGQSQIIHGISRTTAGLYSQTFPFPNGCDSIANITLVVNPVPIVSAGTDVSVCIGETVTLTATGATGYTWTNGLNNTASNTFVPSTVGSTLYTATGTTAGCSAIDVVMVTVNPAPFVNAGIDRIVCSGDSIRLSGSGATTYNWNNGIINDVYFYPTVTMSYIVTGASAGCSASDTVLVTVNPTPQVSFTGINLTGCAPLTSTFTPQITGNVQSVLWSFGDNAISSQNASVSHTYQNSGCYDVALRVVSDQGCVSLTNYSSFVCVLSNPVAQFDFSNDELTSSNTTTHMINNSQNGSTYLWSFGDGSATSNLYEPSHTFPVNQAGNYTVTLVAYSPGGCTDTTKRTIIVSEEIIFYVPNAFTPDGDSFNQTFFPVFTTGFDPFAYTLTMYDRWGEVIFVSHDTVYGWDGTYNGNICQNGSYSWTLRFKVYGKDEYKVYSGHVSLIR